MGVSINKLNTASKVIEIISIRRFVIYALLCITIISFFAIPSHTAITNRSELVIGIEFIQVSLYTKCKCGKK